MQTTQTNSDIDLIRRLFDAFYSADESALRELLDDEFVTHGPNGTGDTGEWISMANQFATALPDNKLAIEDIFAVADRVAVRYTSRGTHSGELFDVAATNKTLTLSGIELYRLENGRIREVWGQYDMGGLFDPQR